MGTGCIKVKLQSDKNEGISQIRPKIRYSKTSMSQIAFMKHTSHNSKESQSIHIEGSSGEIFPLVEKTAEDRANIIKALNSHYIFSSLTEEDKDLITDYMQLYIFQGGSYIFKQGMVSKAFYIIKTGAVEVIVNNRKVNKLSEGEGFGELALLSNSERSATIKCIRTTYVWVIERELFKKLVEDISTQAYEQNRMFLDKIQLLASLTSDQKDILAANMYSRKFKSGQAIVKEGEKGDVMFIIKEGHVLVFKGGKEINQLRNGSIFGEQALIKHTVRNATCVAYGGPVYCVCLSQETIRKVLKYELKEIIQRNYIIEALNKSTTLMVLKPSQKEAIAKELKIIEYNSGDVIIHKGENCSNKLYVIISGRIQNSRNIHLFADKGFCIGDEFIGKSQKNKYEDDFIAACDMQVGEITKYQLEMTLGGKYEDVLNENAAINMLRKIYIFDPVEDVDLKKIIKKVKICPCEDSQIVLNEGQENKNIFIVKKGKVEVFVYGKLFRTITKYGFFGENELIGKKNTDRTYVAQRNTQLWIISYEDFSQIVNKDMLDLLKNREEALSANVLLKDLYPVQEIGRGLFSKVYLMATENGDYYALKTYAYKDIEKLYIHQQIINEKKVLCQIDHRFIVKFIKTFKDSKRIYFLLEFIKGVSLEYLLRSVGILTLKDSRFYLACLILALQYLHERDILYRDLKPENIMIDEEGYIKLIDFNSAKVVSGKSYTICTCPYYIAPEVIVGKGYNKQSELWSLGVLLFEFMCGRVPFGQNKEDPHSIYEEILKTDLAFPSDIPFISENAKNLIEILLQKYPENRFAGSVEKLKADLFFLGFDWDEISRKTAVTPFRSNEFDPIRENSNHFENCQDLDEFLELMSDDSQNSLPPIDDYEINQYAEMIPHNWDDAFD